MDILLILRSEIVCTIILILLLIYREIYSYKTEKTFQRICLLALGHVIFDGVTVVTINRDDLVDRPVNFVMHMFMFIFAIWFCCEIFCYVLKNLMTIAAIRKYLNLFRIPALLYLIFVPFMGVDYVEGNGTRYSIGGGVVVGYGLTLLYALTGMIILIINIRKVERSVIVGLLPVTLFMVLIMLVQIVVPELLFTGGAVTLVTIGLFFAMENPAAHFMRRAYIDLDTGIKNKNCYQEDMKRLNEKFFGSEKKKTDVACVVCDLNGLKAVNDNYGHIAGDELIRAAADVLSKSFISAYNVYRIGGDEFIAVFVGKSLERVKAEVAEVRANCSKYTGLNHPLSIAMGIADVHDDSFLNIFDVVSHADKRMYEDKLEMKNQNPEISVRV